MKLHYVYSRLSIYKDTVGTENLILKASTATGSKDGHVKQQSGTAGYYPIRGVSLYTVSLYIASCTGTAAGDH